MHPVEVSDGDGPVVLGVPHAGTWLPDDARDALNGNGRALADTDWHVDRLYAGLLPSASVVRANFHRYLIDANRDPSGASLYPGQNTTALCPLSDFDGAPIYRPGREPDAAEIERRRLGYHAVYHDALERTLRRVRERHGAVLLFDCHSIRSAIPHLFDGTLPDLNLGSNDGRSCAPGLEAVAAEVCAGCGYSYVVNGRFKGGWTTRHYGRPDAGRHALQLELAQSTYLRDEAAPFDYDDVKATALRRTLAELLARLHRQTALRPQR